MKSTTFPLSGKAVILIKEIQPVSFAWRRSMLHPFTTMSLIIVSLQIRSKNWHAAEVRSVVTWIASFFLSSIPLSLFHPWTGIQHRALQGLMHRSDARWGKSEASYKSRPRPQLAQHLPDLPKRLVTAQSMVPQCAMVDSANCFDSWSDLSSWCLFV